MIPVYWLALVIILLLIEALTMGLTTIWFSGGALAAFVISLTGLPVFVQVAVFLVVSALLLIFTRPAAAKFMNQKIEKTNVDSLLDKKAVVVEKIDNLKGSGRVMINGVDWSARSLDEDKVFEKDAVVRILRVDGVKLMVDSAAEERSEK